MTLSPTLAKTIVEKIPGVKPVFSQRGPSKGQHLQYAYRFEFRGQLTRHISISRRPTDAGITVYANQQSINNVPFPALKLRSIRVSQKYPKGSQGKTGDKGLSSSAGGLPSLNPIDNDVLRLSLSTEESFRQFLAWYLDIDLSNPAQLIEWGPDKIDSKLINQSSMVELSVSSISPSDQAKFESDTKNLTTDEREAFVKIRYGQGSFRELLVRVAGEKCWMTGLEGKELLIASHIKPWAHCNKDTKSRGQPDNGLLLSALWDSAFDAGLITFDQNWNVVISSKLSESAKSELNIKQYSTLPEFFRNNCRSRFLAYHRVEVFDQGSK